METHLRRPHVSWPPVSVFGPPSGTYDGPYPTREEAVAASTPGILVSPEDFAAGRIPTENEVVQLDPAIMEKISLTSFEFTLFSLGEWELEEGGTLHAVLLDERYLILRLRYPPTLTSDEVATEVVLLIDATNSRPFAIYRITGSPRIRRSAVSAFW